jgi:predicted dehydrogenase
LATKPVLPVIEIHGRRIESGYPVYVIAEMSANHGQSFAHAGKIIEAAKQSGADAVKLQTYTPDTLTIDSDMEFSRVGEVGHYLPDWHPWEDYRQSYSARRELGGGVILDAIHEIDNVRWLLGKVAEATCLAGKLSQLEIDTEDIAAILLRFESGAVGEVHLDYIQRAYRRTCQIIGEDGTLHWDYTAGEVRWFSAQTKQWKVYGNPIGWNPNQMYLDEMRHFLRCVTGEEEPTLDVYDAAQVLRIALAAKESARQQRWIELRSQTWNTNSIL